MSTKVNLSAASKEEAQDVLYPANYPPYPSTQFSEPEASTSVSFAHYLWILKRQAWKMAAFVAICVLFTFVVSSRLKPIYRSTAMIHVDLQAPSEIVGQGSTGNTYIDPEEVLTTQISIIQSDAVVRPVAERFHLGIFQAPNKGPDSKGTQETIDAPVSLAALKVARPLNTDLLLISYEAQDPRVAADVANAVANSYINHLYDIRIRSSADLSTFMDSQLDELKAKMEKSGLALAAYEKDLEVINPNQKTDILSARLTQLNNEYTTAQAETIHAEAEWNEMKSGSAEAAEVSTQGGSLAALSGTLDQAREHLAEVQAVYGANHPEYKKAAATVAAEEEQFEAARRQISNRVEVAYKNSLSREKRFQKAVADTKAEWDLLNSRTYQYQQLKQEADTDKALYDELIKKIHEAGINEGFKDNNVRISDIARPSPTPISPNTKRNVEVMLLLSLILAVGSAIVLDSMDTTLRDPEIAGRYLGADIIGTLPLDEESVRLSIFSQPKASVVATALGSNGSEIVNHHRISAFEESVRTIRNTILLADSNHRLGSIVITSAALGEGKTTFAVHFAIANAARGKKTLLVDCDLRRPSIHSRFGIHPKEGLSTVLNGVVVWRDAVIPIEKMPQLSLLPSGPGSHRAADLIGPRLSELLDEFAKEYDLVILDAPPLLGFAEGLQMATAADGVLIISRAGDTKRKAVATVVTNLRRVQANILGVILNRVSYNTSGDVASYYGHYDYSGSQTRQ